MGRKRPRSPSQPKSKQGYLTDVYPKSKAIKVQLSAIKATQARILTRSLREAGAHVLDDKDEEEPAVVITDKAPPPQDGNAPLFVPPRWAHDVLKRRRAVSPTRYVLESKEDVPTEAATAKEALPPRTRLPAVWEVALGGAATRNQRMMWLKALPLQAAERATYTEDVFRSPNAKLVQALRDVGRVRELLAGEDGIGAMRGLAYKNAAAALASLPFVMEAREAAHVPAVGTGVADAIREYCATSEVKEAGLLLRDERLRALDVLTGVYGVGFKGAQRLYEGGVRSVMQLHELAQRSGGAVRGIKLPERPHDSLTLTEARAFREAGAECWRKAGLELRVALCGGYRRAKQRGHDVDIVICRKDGANHAPLLDQLADALEAAGILRERWRQGDGSKSYGAPKSKTHAEPVRELSHETMHAVCAYGGRVFRTDLVAVRDAKEFCYATLAWSGSVTFQRSIRRYAVGKGMVFSAHGLFDAGTGMRVPASEHVRSEHDVFHVLGLTYRPPFERAA